MNKRIIIVLCIVVALAGFFGGVVYQIERAKLVWNEYTELEDKYDALFWEYNKAQGYFNELVFEYEKIKESYEKLLGKDE